MRNMLCTIAAAAMLTTASSSLASAQYQSYGYQPGYGAASPPAYGSSYPPSHGSNTYPQQPTYGAVPPPPGYGGYPTGAEIRGQPSPTTGIPGGNQPSASAHATPY